MLELWSVKRRSSLRRLWRVRLCLYKKINTNVSTQGKQHEKHSDARIQRTKQEKKSHFQLESRVGSNRTLHPEDEDDAGDENGDSEGS